MNQPTAMIAMGGNSLSPKGEAGTISQQFSHTRETLDGITHFIDRGYNLCINHGNGPQVGNELLRMDLTHNKVPPIPLGICVAGTQGTIGYMIQQSLQNKLRDLNIDREVVTLVSQVIVDENDPSITKPSKFVGARYSKKEALSLAKKFHWIIKEQEPNLWRRVVPSPMPKYIMHGKSIKSLVDRGTIVIASGGGGIPVFNNSDGHLEGLDAVIDKDYSAAKLGRILHAEELWIITDVDNIYLNYGTDQQESIRTLSTTEAENLYEKGEFQQGSIAPKIKAAIHFLKYHGEKVIITSIPCIKAALDGKAGTEIRNEK
ncbi:MAG: carbamate kinase [Candidatus Marinimicrobia bacterium]|nr:carbamate kinase [Candidatus Neomarinimicrobiota bacterium]MBT3500851.1 carbamate kinase [Candidatus Neomarinimicrobiota bacterium]MBT3838885.1 carbamate kinase [Candidatus Neomarinimicrobiota bacterium]MBT3998634.1 carbamate kinase [Candidatus Neomarinimicrobiota bacterium]MBT4282819.1 carbamate kinase [Candidatus Neomarinimicrobiota bacterium]